LIASLIGAALVLYFLDYTDYNPPAINSLVAPLILALIYSFFIGRIVAGSISYPISCGVCYFNLQ
jgi:hypothetical protein